MELVVISPEGECAEEIAVLEQLCAAGLKRYHVRKPGWGAAKLEAWLGAVPDGLRARMVLHSHHELVARYGLLGRHWRDGEAPEAAPRDGGWTSCSCHRLGDLRRRAEGYASVFFSPVFVSQSKPGRAGLGKDALAEVSAYLKAEDRGNTQVIALSGITPERVEECAALGFDGVAVQGGIWVASPQAELSPPDWALRQYRLYKQVLLPPVMCLTLDGESLPHAEQARQLCAAGAKLVQLRCKGLADAAWLALAREAVGICHAHGAMCIVNDRPDLAIAAGADGAHVGKTDGDWLEARRTLGPARLLGGTVNNVDEARRAIAAGCLDYVGVGPMHFTTSKQKLAPVLGVAGIQGVIAELDGLPAWVIGGVQAADLPEVRQTGAAGIAVASVLYRGSSVAARYQELAHAWQMAARLELSPTVS